VLSSPPLAFDASGRIRNTATAPTDFVGGVGFVGPLLSVHTIQGIDHFHHGQPYTAASALAAASALPTNFSQGGLPINSVGRLCIVVDGVVSHHNHGLPMSADSRLVLAIAE
jgi:hypothetical protein